MARNFFIRPDSASTDCALATDSSINDQILNAQTAGNEANSETVEQGSNINNYVSMAFVMPSGEIGGEDLAAGSLFTAILDITAIGSFLSCNVVFHAYNPG